MTEGDVRQKEAGIATSRTQLAGMTETATASLEKTREIEATL